VTSKKGEVVSKKNYLQGSMGTSHSDDLGLLQKNEKKIGHVTSKTGEKNYPQSSMGTSNGDDLGLLHQKQKNEKNWITCPPKKEKELQKNYLQGSMGTSHGDDLGLLHQQIISAIIRGPQ
jgi:hypothetical protein